MTTPNETSNLLASPSIESDDSQNSNLLLSPKQIETNATAKPSSLTSQESTGSKLTNNTTNEGTNKGLTFKKLITGRKKIESLTSKKSKSLSSGGSSWKDQLKSVVNTNLITKYVKNQENAMWLAVLLSKLFMIMVELISLMVIWFQSRSSRILFEKIPAYGNRQNNIFSSLIIISCCTNLFIVCIAFYSKHIVTWSKASIIPRCGIILSVVQVIIMFLAFIISSISYSKITWTLHPSDFFVVTNNFYDDFEVHFYMNRIQMQHECCGIRGPFDWVHKNGIKVNTSTTDFHVPPSCCVNAKHCTYTPAAVKDNAFEQGCYRYLMIDMVNLMKSKCVVYGIDILLQLPLLILFLMSLPDLAIMATLHDTIDYLEEEGLMDKDEEDEEDEEKETSSVQEKPNLKRKSIYFQPENATGNNLNNNLWKRIDKYKKERLENKNYESFPQHQRVSRKEPVDEVYKEYRFNLWLNTTKHLP